ncbi:MAG TPA: FAD-dependent oxidoreductase, partial [Candidatus Limnocylindria bacterium]|nr:FAD-dependent oxidoreductase [Candidatus Limnocylindria bacterium]
RVCQYEATPDSHFLIDRHPAWSNAWVVGGGSGHGFKHGPVIGEFVAAQLVGDAEVVAGLAPPDDRFAFGPRDASTDAGLRTSGSPAHRHR